MSMICSVKHFNRSQCAVGVHHILKVRPFGVTQVQYFNFSNFQFVGYLKLFLWCKQKLKSSRKISEEATLWLASSGDPGCVLGCMLL